MQAVRSTHSLEVPLAFNGDLIVSEEVRFQDHPHSQTHVQLLFHCGRGALEWGCGIYKADGATSHYRYLSTVVLETPDTNREFKTG